MQVTKSILRMAEACPSCSAENANRASRSLANANKHDSAIRSLAEQMPAVLSGIAVAALLRLSLDRLIENRGQRLAPCRDAGQPGQNYCV
jgi:hypothetical protein